MTGGSLAPKLLAVLIFFAARTITLAGEVAVSTPAELRNALRDPAPGTTILIAPGEYGSGYRVANITATHDNPIVITGDDEANPPVFTGGSQAFHFTSCNFIMLRHVVVRGSTHNGINADDGGDFATPSRGMTFENITIENIGPTGNRDGLKLSGLRDFAVRNVTISGWGGSAIDMVGCHDGIIEDSRFIGREGFSQSSGIQAKGGSERITIRRNFFHRAGQRAVNIGGSTGLAYFRPEVRNYEARDIDVIGNHFVGGTTPIAFVTSIDCRVRHNTIIHPEKWILRILQEQPLDQFLPCQNGIFESNLIVFDRRVQTFVNVGPNTKPETFIFRRNAWYSSDDDRIPSLPVEETDGVYQVDPMIEGPGTPDIRITSTDPRLQAVGAHAAPE